MSEGRSKVRSCLGKNGDLAKHLPAYSERQGQLEMAEAIFDALDSKQTLFCEAGTGIGKTMAYLTPAMLADKCTVISTGTRHLQDQLFNKDLPVLCKILNWRNQRVRVLKGRSNYLCLQRLHAIEQGGSEQDGALHGDGFQQLRNMLQWSQHTRSGDMTECPDLPEDAPIARLAVSNRENCLRSACPRYEDCFVYQARENARSADIIITNHALLLADLVLREQGGGALLPDNIDTVIFDEAHLLPEMATHAFGTSLSSSQLEELANDVLQADDKEGGELPNLRDAVRILSQAVKEMLYYVQSKKIGNAALRDLHGEQACMIHLERMHSALGALSSILQTQEERGDLMKNCAQRTHGMHESLGGFIEDGEEESAGKLHWVETFKRSFHLNVTPLDVAHSFRARMDKYAHNCIFTSATLGLGKDSGYFAERLGFADAHHLQVASPFNFREQALLYIPNDLPEPGDPRFLDEAFPERVRQLLVASQGRAFILFTSHNSLQRMARRMQDQPQLFPWKRFVQGDASRHELLDHFRAEGNAVLLGTSSFWEGVDIRGPALSCVIIEKLPFANPQDPLVQARAAAMERAGRNPFMEYQIPQAMILLKQGVGRLIRDISDFGVCAICDRRLLEKPYGGKFLAMFAEWRKTRELPVVEHFFAQLERTKQA
ncbi:MAG: ATP-dependent DNA helicase [Candidatus Eutrophobiaceae bacterium]